MSLSQTEKECLKSVLENVNGWERRYKEEVAFERLVLHAFRLPHAVTSFRVLSDLQGAKSSIGEAQVVRRGRLKTVAGTSLHINALSSFFSQSVVRLL